jgi:hypothetical protein
LLVSIRYVEYLKSQEAEDREEGKEDAKRGVNLKRGGMRSRGKGEKCEKFNVKRV